MTTLRKAVGSTYTAVGSLVIVAACMEGVGEITAAKSNLLLALLVVMLLVGAVIFLGLALHQAWQVPKLVFRGLDDATVEYQVKNFPLK